MRERLLNVSFCQQGRLLFECSLYTRAASDRAYTVTRPIQGFSFSEFFHLQCLEQKNMCNHQSRSLETSQEYHVTCTSALDICTNEIYPLYAIMLTTAISFVKTIWTFKGTVAHFVYFIACPVVKTREKIPFTFYEQPRQQRVKRLHRSYSIENSYNSYPPKLQQLPPQLTIATPHS